MIIRSVTQKLGKTDTAEHLFSRVCGDWSALFHDQGVSFIGFKPVFTIEHSPETNLKVSSLSYLPDSIEEEAQIFEGDPWKMLMAMMEQMKPEEDGHAENIPFIGGAVGIKLNDHLNFALYDRAAIYDPKKRTVMLVASAEDSAHAEMMLHNMASELFFEAEGNGTSIEKDTTCFELPDGEIHVKFDPATAMNADQARGNFCDFLGYISLDGKSRFFPL